VKRLLSFLTVLCLLTAEAAQACTACFGKTNEPLARGMNAGIYVMLVFVVGFWILFGSFFVFIARRARRVNPENPDSNPIS
jgi:preprotein translocase subunit SecY